MTWKGQLIGYSGKDISTLGKKTRSRLENRVGQLSAAYLAERTNDEVVAEIESEFLIDLPVPRFENATRKPLVGKRLPVGHQSYEGIEIFVPVEGRAEALFWKPNQWSTNPPMGHQAEGGIKLLYALKGDVDDLKKEFEQDRKRILQVVEWIHGSLNNINQQVCNSIPRLIEARRDELRHQSDQLDALGIPLVGPEPLPISVKRKAIQLKPSKTHEKDSRPRLSEDQVNGLQETMDLVGRMLESNPTAFHALDEEAIRMQFLVALNAAYHLEGTAESFRKKGKTDILLNYKGEIVHVTEAKFWTGPKGARKALTQLLGYITWRETNAQLLILVRGTNFETVMEKLPRALREHEKVESISEVTAGKWDVKVVGEAGLPHSVRVCAYHIPEPEAA